MTVRNDRASLRVATYNVHGCAGTDGQRSEERIAEVIASLDVDLVGLQELDLNRKRSMGVDQAALIARRLGWQRHFFPARRKGGEEYGDAVISRLPLTLRKAAELPAKAPWFCPEPRGAIWVEMVTPHGPCHVINTHFGLGRRERLEQAALLAGEEWLGSAPDEPVIVMGDFNAPNSSRALTLLAQTLSPEGPRTRSPLTFPARRPLRALDHILVNRHLRVSTLSTVKTPVTRVASDHLPVVAEITWVEED